MQRRRSLLIGSFTVALMVAVAGCATNPEKAPTSPRPTASASGSPSASPRTSLSFVGIHMLDSASGWATTRGDFLYTSDGGRHWSRRNPAGFDATSTGPSGTVAAPLSNAAFAGPDEAWIAVSTPGTVTVFHSTDAGMHWSRAVVKPDFAAGMPATDIPSVLDLTFADRRNGWLLATSGGMGLGGEDVELYRTTDGGVSWGLAAMATQQGPSPTGLPAGGIKTGIGFANPHQGWLTGYRGSEAGIWLYRTNDAGTTWARTTLPTPAGHSSTEFPLTFPPVFIGPSAGVLPTAWTAPSGSDTVFFVTPDSGATWRASTPIRSTSPMHLWSWPSMTHGVAANNTTLCTTSTGGTRWQCNPLPASLNGPTALDFVSAQRGWMIATGRLFETTDGGRNWVPVHATVR